VFETSDDQIHILVKVAQTDGCLARQSHVLFIVQVAGCALEVKHAVLGVDNFEERLVLWVLSHSINLIFEGFGL
jgi:hypothetical protein